MGLAERKYQPPPRTGMEVFMMLPEGTLAELINDVIYMSPSPSFHHQDLSTELAMQIRTHVKKNKLGTCVSAPMDVFLDNRNAVQPDLLVILADSLIILTDDGKIKGVPDFIIEILSPGNKKHDTEKKKTLYERFGVKEYFIIDPDNRETTTYYLANKKFVKQEALKGKVKSKLLKKVFTF
ncbi:MAG TPA: Uma2 family endonuclease [Chitinophagaceae bacterium]|nr:Uma2 family endonuclease [Chitinophagaceae bacterium]